MKIPWKQYTSYLWAAKLKTDRGTVTIELWKVRHEKNVRVRVNDRQPGHYTARISVVDPPETWHEASLIGLQFLKAIGCKPNANDCTGTEQIGNYDVRLSKWGRPRSVWKTGGFKGFPRKRLGPWDLLLCSLIATIGDRVALYGCKPKGDS